MTSRRPPHSPSDGADPTYELRTEEALRIGSAEARASLIIHQPSGQQIVALAINTPIVIGRSEPADIPINDRSLSRRHAKVEWRSDGVWIEDLGSTNGTTVQDKQIESARIQPGDVVSIGSVRVSLHMVAPEPDVRLGVELHDVLREAVEREVQRARYFGESFAVFSLRAGESATASLAQWCPAAQAALRPVDRVARYSPSLIEVLSPGMSPEEAAALASRVSATGAAAPVHVGIAPFPASGTSADRLLDASRIAVRDATNDQPVRVARSEAARTLEASDPAPVANSAKMRAIFETVPRLARSSIPVLIHGETGTGKEVVAQAIHARSTRHGSPICAVNCAAIPGQLVESTLFGHERGAFTGAVDKSVGVFEAAHRGTVFLDEIGELPAHAQATLLRVLETKRICRVGSTSELAVDVRIIAATHRDIEAMCDEASFRWDLLYRLNTMTLDLPPLRERREDIDPLVERFVAQANRDNGCRVREVDPATSRLLLTYQWPGNVRELRNAIERAVVLAEGPVLLPEHLPDRVRAAPGIAATPQGPSTAEHEVAPIEGTFKSLIQTYEAKVLKAAIQASDGNKAEAARRLDMPYRTLAAKVRAYGLTD